MSLEQSMHELKGAIDNLVNVMQTINFDSSETPPSTDQPSDSKAPEPATGNVASRKQYIFFKDLNSGTVLEKGDQVPAENGATGVNKVTFEKLAKKHNFDPETGQALEDPTAQDGEDDMVSEDTAQPEDDGLDEAEAAPAEPEAAADEPDEFDLDDEEEEEGALTEADVKGALMKFIEARQGDRELGLKVLKKFDAASISALPKDKYAEVVDFCTRGAEKALSKKA